MCFHRTRFRNAAGKANKRKQGQSSSFIFSFPSTVDFIGIFICTERRTYQAWTQHILYLHRKWLHLRTVASCLWRTIRWVCPHQLTHFIVHMDKTYYIHILFNKAAHNRELAFEMAFVCLRAHNMCWGSKAWCFVILQIKTKQFPFEFINISGRNTSLRALLCAYGDMCPAGCELSTKQ